MGDCEPEHNCWGAFWKRKVTALWEWDKIRNIRNKLDLFGLGKKKT